MKKYLAAVAFAALLVSTPAQASNELVGAPIETFASAVSTREMKIEKLSEADVKKSEEAAPRPPQLKDTDIYIVWASEYAVVILVRDGVIVFSSNKVELQNALKVLGRSGA